MAKDIQSWNPEDPQEWESSGRSIASRNLWISIPNLLCGFSVWLYWGMIAKVMQRLHFANSELFNSPCVRTFPLPVLPLSRDTGSYCRQ